MQTDVVELLREHLRAAPQDADRHARLAAQLASLGRTAEARDALRHAVSVLPVAAGLWWRLAIAESNMGDGNAALACLARAIEAGPREAEDWRRIGWTYLEYWRYAEAQAALEKAAALDPAGLVLEGGAERALSELRRVQRPGGG